MRSFLLGCYLSLVKLATSLQKLVLLKQESSIRFSFNQGLAPRVFNLDVHISVIADVEAGLGSKNVDLIKWSLSGNNQVFRKFRRYPDPVSTINASTWENLDDHLIEKFTSRYQGFLKSFDGFIAAHPVSFSRIYDKFEKPTLTIASTRYELSFTNNPAEWELLNQTLKRQSDRFPGLLASNNRGDQDYLKYHAGLSARYVPSVCDYTNVSWVGGGTNLLIFAKSSELIDEIEAFTEGLWLAGKKVLGSNYSWRDLARARAILVIPYNISTMTMFELATMGVPVIVPSRNFFMELIAEHSGVLSELSFFQIHNLDVSSLSEHDPNNFKSLGFYDWWLSRADFYDPALMPNVRVIDNFRELLDPNFLLSDFQSSSYRTNLEIRNGFYKESRNQLLKTFAGFL